MKNILYEGYEGPRLPREVQLKRVQRVIREELTENQREILLAYYMQIRPSPRSPKSGASTKAPYPAPFIGRKVSCGGFSGTDRKIGLYTRWGFLYTI